MASADNFTPKRRLITDVTVAIEPTVTTTEAHGYEVGRYVRLHVEKSYGMEILGKRTKILTVPSTTTFTCDYDTSALEVYSTPAASTPPAPATRYTQAHVVPIDGLLDNDATVV